MWLTEQHPLSSSLVGLVAGSLGLLWSAGGNSRRGWRIWARGVIGGFSLAVLVLSLALLALCALSWGMVGSGWNVAG
jgi:hypothetical protein